MQSVWAWQEAEVRSQRAEVRALTFRLLTSPKIGVIREICGIRTLPMRPSESSMLTPEELRLQTRKRRRLMLLLVIVLLLAAGVFFAARPTRDAIKGWQARRHAQKAFAMIAQQNWNDARTEAVAAYQLRSTEPEALRAVARFLSRTRQPQALEFWAQLSKEQALTREDLRDEATVAMVAGDSERADQVGWSHHANLVLAFG